MAYGEYGLVIHCQHGVNFIKCKKCTDAMLVEAGEQIEKLQKELEQLKDQVVLTQTEIETHAFIGNSAKHVIEGLYYKDLRHMAKQTSQQSTANVVASVIGYQHPIITKRDIRITDLTEILDYWFNDKEKAQVIAERLVDARYIKPHELTDDVVEKLWRSSKDIYRFAEELNKLICDED